MGCGALPRRRRAADPTRAGRQRGQRRDGPATGAAWDRAARPRRGQRATRHSLAAEQPPPAAVRERTRVLVQGVEEGEQVGGDGVYAGVRDGVLVARCLLVIPEDDGPVVAQAEEV